VTETYLLIGFTESLFELELWLSSLESILDLSWAVLDYKKIIIKHIIN